MAIYEDVNGRLLGKRYRVKGELGRGAFGVVFRATHEVLGVDFRDVALKVFANEYVTRENAKKVFNEAVQLEKLASHARTRGDQLHLVVVYDIGILDDYQHLPYIAMELVDGGSLEGQIRTGLGFKEAVRLVRQICAGVKLAHEQGVYHRDLKPANVLFTNSGFLKVSDFGLAIDRHTAFRAGSHAGTISYAPPDTGVDRMVSGSFDVYSLGIILLEFMLKDNPLDPVLRNARRRSVDHAVPLLEAQTWLADLKDPTTHRPIADGLLELRNDDGMQDILRSCLALDAGRRYKDAGAFDGALDQWQRKIPPPPPPPREFREALDSAIRLLEAGRHVDAKRDLEASERLTRRRPDQAALAFAWSRWFEATANLKHAISKQEEGIGFERTAASLHRLADLFALDNKPAAALAFRAEARSLQP